MQFPHKECKVSSLAKNSRPPSPDLLTQSVTEVRKHGPMIGRKRKHNSVEVCVCSVCVCVCECDKRLVVHNVQLWDQAFPKLAVVAHQCSSG